MHSAPAVSYPVGRSSIRTLVYLVPWLAGGAVIAVWVLQSGRSGPMHGLAFFLWLLAGMPVILALRRTAGGVLRWDGQQWTWEVGTRLLVGSAIRRLDWQIALLLEFRLPQGGVLWLWPERRLDPLRWDDLRRALQASLTAETRPAGAEVQP